jgi:hypothetical protein
MMTKDDRRARAQELRRRLREKYDMPPDWPLRFDLVTHEYYYPLERYLAQPPKAQGRGTFRRGAQRDRCRGGR